MLFLKRNGRLGLIFALSHLNVLGNINQYRAGSAGACQDDCLADGICQLLDRADKVVMLGDGQRNTRDINLLEGVGTDLCAENVTRDGQHGNAVQVRRRNTGNQVCRAGTGGGKHNADLTRSARVAVSGVCRALLVRRQDVLDLVLIFIQRIVNVNDLTAGITEDGLAFLLDQCSDQNVSTG